MAVRRRQPRRKDTRADRRIARPRSAAPRRYLLWGAPLLLSAGIVAAAASGMPGWSETPEPAAVVDTAPPADSQAEAAPALAPPAAPLKDPLRAVNRKAFALNRFLDKAILGPIAHVYRAVTPAPVQRGVSHVVDNLREPSTVLNDVLQGHPKKAAKATARFAVNSTVGLLGLFDVATKAGLDRHRSDFGQTLGRYGVGPGAYVYLPVVGPLNVRDGVGTVVDVVTDPVALLTGGTGTDFARDRLAVTVVDTRANADGTLRALNEEATDPYAATRSAYDQNRAAAIREATGETEALPDFEPEPAAAEPPPPHSSAPAPSPGPA